MFRLPNRVLRALLAVAAVAFAAASTRAVAVEHRIPIKGGKVTARHLSDSIAWALRQPAAPDPAAEIDVAGDNAATVIAHLVDTLGPQACSAKVDGQTLVVSLDAETANRDTVAVRRTARILATGRAFRPADPKNGFGIALPEKVDVAKPLTVMVHGIDSRGSVWDWMVATMTNDGGWQPAVFTYPDDGPCAGGAELLADCLADVRLRHPKVKINLLTHSMGGLVAREYVEGPTYRAGTIDRLVMVGPPNHGSTYTRMRWALEWFEHYKRCKQEGGWEWAKMKEDGDGEAGTDLAVGSPFLTQLNARGRREGVRYTIVAGNKNGIQAAAADVMAAAADGVPDAIAGWWGVKQAREGLAGKANAMRAEVADADGPVTVDSAKLDGVTDFTVIHADHLELIIGQPPAAWELIKARLKE